MHRNINFGMLKIYRASAGSGKTFKLVEEYLYLLFRSTQSVPHRHILAVTFTNKATEEMKTRIIMELHQMAQGENTQMFWNLKKSLSQSEENMRNRAKSLLVNILYNYSAFSINTIDSFFQKIIRAFAREIGVHGSYNLELDSEFVLHQATDNLFNALSSPDNKQLLEWMTQYAEERVEKSENWNSQRDIETLGKEIFKENYQHKADETNIQLHNHEFLKSYKSKLYAIKNLFEQKVKNEAKQAKSIIAQYGLQYEDFSNGKKGLGILDKLENGIFKINSYLEKYAEDVSKCCVAKPKNPETKSAIEAAYSAGLGNCFKKIVEMFTGEPLIDYNSALLILKHLNTLGIMSNLAKQIKMLTEEQNMMLISDANMLLNKIINKSETPFIYEKTGSYIDSYMIDEFQDTSILQWKNFFPLVKNSIDSGKENLLVGDVKQSIYRWRNSDWTLLDSKVEKQVGNQYLISETLDKNWRSAKNVIDFNNRFFRFAASVLQNKFDADSGTAEERINHAYLALEQLPQKDTEGYVQFQFIDSDEDEKWQEKSLDELPHLLETLQERNIRPCDVAILVRRNSEAQQVAQKLLSYKISDKAKPNMSYDIVGNEGLLVSSASSVRFIVGILRLFANPSDVIQQAMVSFEYERARNHKSESEALNFFIDKRNVADKISPCFTDEENEKLLKIKSLSLYEMIENIIELFDIGNWQNEAIFVQAFQDVVFKFTFSKNVYLYSFLQWWDTNGVRQTIATPENANTFHLMTIHKSKGLEFKVVIMPFGDWKMEKKSNFLIKNILWCNATKAPFNEISLLPLEYSSSLKTSIFTADYFHEMLHNYIDTLNMSYVAFTRAVNELYVFAPAPKINNSGERKSDSNSLAGLLFDAFENQQVFDNYESFNDNDFIFRKGTLPEYQRDIEEKQTLPEKTLFHSTSNKNRLHIRHHKLDFWNEKSDFTSNKRSYGIVMHDILRNIRCRSDQQTAIDNILRSGRINTSEVEEIKAEFDKFWKIPNVEEWFSPDVKTLNEATIITPKGEHYRPDRVIIENNIATIIDYKFGEHRKSAHIAQVQNYKALIAEMGYTTKGFLCYVNLGVADAV